MAFRYDTKVVTSRGWETIQEHGEVHEVGDTIKVTFQHAGIKTPEPLIVYASRHQPWTLPDRETVTRELKEGDIVASNMHDHGFSGSWWLEGFKFGLGHAGGPIKVPNRLELFRQRVTSFTKEDEPRGVLPPDTIRDPASLGSFIRGWVNSTGNNSRLVTTNREALDFFLQNAPMAGYVVTGTPRYNLEKKGQPGQKPIVCHDVSYAKGSIHKGWRAKEIKLVMNDPEPYFVTPAPIALIGGILGLSS